MQLSQLPLDHQTEFSFFEGLERYERYERYERFDGVDPFEFEAEPAERQKKKLRFKRDKIFSAHKKSSPRQRRSVREH